MDNMDAKFSSLVDRTMHRYGLPPWLKPYVFDYIKSNPLNAIKHATSFIEIRRKKGEITREHVRLPNGFTFRIGFIEEMLSLFRYGEERIDQIYGRWAAEPGYEDLERKKRYRELSLLSKKHLRAIDNLMEGIGIELRKPKKEVKELFDYIEALSSWDDRIIASGIFIKYSFSYPFGFVFYKVFYPVAPEFMRSFGKAFNATTEATHWLEGEAKKIAFEKKDSGELRGITEQLLARISASISSEEQTAKANGIANEVKLLQNIALAYPLHVLAELGVDIEVSKEVKKVLDCKRTSY